MRNRTRLTAGLLAGASVLAYGSLALAQAAKSTTAAAEVTVEDVIVTGSRVIQNGNNSPNPVTVINTQQLMELTPTIVADALNTLPAFTGSVTQTTNPGNSSQNNAAQILNLRAVGSSRLLILFDGHRVAPTSPLGDVDVDTIPQLLLQRVDVVTGGASAVYGSDAVSGVVNFITDKNFNGFKASTNTGISQYGDDNIFDVAVAGGKSFLDGRLHLEGSAQYHNDPGIFTKLDRPWGAEDWTIQGGGTAANPSHLVPHSVFGQSSFGGVITSGPLVSGSCTALVIACNYLQFKQNGVATPFVHGTASGTANIESGGDGAYYSSASLKSLLVSKQYFGRADYDFTDKIHGYVQVARTENRNMNNHQWVEVRGTNGGSPGVLGLNNAFLKSVIFPAGVTNPYNAASTATFNFGKMLTQTKPFQPETFENNDVVITNLSGDLGEYKWEAGYEHAKATQYTRNNNNLNQAKMLAAENAVFDASGKIVCNAALVNPAVYGSCVPINLFGPTSESAEALKYVTGVTEYWAHTKMDDFTAQITGAPISTWAGPVNMALSAEYRKTGYDLNTPAGQQPTDLANCVGIQFNCNPASTTVWASNTLANRSPVSQAVKEVAYEFDAPLLKDAPFFESLNLNGAYRYTKYANEDSSKNVTTEFTAKTWKLGLDWHVSDEVKFRATVSHDIRAPNLNELFAPTLVNPAGATDYLVNGGAGTNLQAPQLRQSNPSLQPEEADTKTAGVVLTPSFLPGFSLSVDAYRITVNGYITNINGGNQVIQQICIASGGSSPFCALTPRPFPITNTTLANLLTATIQQPQNIASLDTYGADIEANYSTRLFDRPLSLRTFASYQPHILLNNGPTGFVDNGGTNPAPMWKATFIGKYNVTDAFSVSVLEKYRGHLRWTGIVNTDAKPPIPAISPPIFSEPRIPAIMFTDITFNYAMKRDNGGNLDLYLSIRNLFNHFPGRAGGGGSVPGLFGGFVAGDDTVGRYYMVGARFRY